MKVELIGVLSGGFLLKRLQTLFLEIKIFGTKHVVLQCERQICGDIHMCMPCRTRCKSADLVLLQQPEPFTGLRLMPFFMRFALGRIAPCRHTEVEARC